MSSFSITWHQAHPSCLSPFPSYTQPIEQEVVRITSSQRLHSKPMQKPALTNGILGGGKSTYCAYRGANRNAGIEDPNPRLLAIPCCQGMFLPGYLGQWRNWRWVSFSSYTGCGVEGGWCFSITTSVFVVIDTHWDRLRARAKPTSKLWCLRRGLRVIQPPLFHFSLLPFTGLVGHPGLPLSLHPLFTPFTKALLSTAYSLVWMQVYQ